jgi:hypothetical protein
VAAADRGAWWRRLGRPEQVDGGEAGPVSDQKRRSGPVCWQARKKKMKID